MFPDIPVPISFISVFSLISTKKVKVKLFLCYFLTEHHAMKAYWGSGIKQYYRT